LNSQLLFILLLAMVAGIILFRLYSVLGRRTGHERPPQERFERVGGAAEPPKAAEKPVQPVLSGPGAKPETVQTSDAVTAALTQIALADRSFTAAQFLEGARRAYEMIVTAFARGERDALRPLLSEEVFVAFEQVIAEREAQKRRVEFTLVGFREAKIVHASLKNIVSEITVSFETQFNSATFDEKGALVEGDPKLVRDVADIWTFERNVRASDPNWKLVSTSGEAGLQEH
jgi:predicted lipid-binding transport protein (Tim44 family)